MAQPFKSWNGMPFTASESRYLHGCMIQLEGITKSFGALQVLKGIDLEIGKGEVVSIVGPSGAGKTKKDQIATASSLGLRKIGDKATQPDNPQTQGKIKKISHLIEVTKA